MDAEGTKKAQNRVQLSLPRKFGPKKIISSETKFPKFFQIHKVKQFTAKEDPFLLDTGIGKSFQIGAIEDELASVSWRLRHRDDFARFIDLELIAADPFNCIVSHYFGDDAKSVFMKDVSSVQISDHFAARLC